MAKRALITGITGQDGAYLAQLLLEKGYEVFGAYRRSSTRNIWRLNELGIVDRVSLVCMELTDQSSVQHVLEQIMPDEVYNLAAQSFVQESFNQPIYTGDLDGLSVTRILESIRTVNPKIKFYQASTSEMFGKVQAVPQSETTPFYPRSPYVWLSFMGIGLRLTIVSPMICLLVLAFYLITSRHYVGCSL